MTAPEFAVGAAIAYFVIFGLGFVFKPELISRFGLRWTDGSGRTEVRCYYGAVSIAIGAFLVYLLTEDLAVQALTGVLLLAGSVLTMRVVGTTIDKGWGDPYTKLAIPAEAAMVGALTIVRVIA